MQLSFTILPLLAALASAAPAADIFRRAEATCGTVYYSASAVNAASVAACNYFRAGNTAGSSSYPHRYNNYEGFNFGGAAGPYQEFPIMSNGQVYSGGKLPKRCALFDMISLMACRLPWSGSCGYYRVVVQTGRYHYSHWRIGQQLRCLQGHFLEFIALKQFQFTMS